MYLNRFLSIFLLTICLLSTTACGERDNNFDIDINRLKLKIKGKKLAGAINNLTELLEDEIPKILNTIDNLSEEWTGRADSALVVANKIEEEFSRLNDNVSSLIVIIEELRQDLPNLVEFAVTDIERALGSVLNDANAGGLCIVDYLQQNTVKILGEVSRQIATGEYRQPVTEATLPPTICHVTPSKINLNHHAAVWEEIKYAGFGFSTENLLNLNVLLVNDNGFIKDISHNFRRRADHQMVLNLSGVGGTIPDTTFLQQFNRLILQDADTNILSEINIFNN